MKQPKRTWGSVAVGVIGALFLVLIGWMPAATEAFKKGGVVQLQAASLTGTVGKPLKVRVETPQESLLSGVMYTVTTLVLQPTSEGAPDILTGIPLTTLTFGQPGEYRIRFRVNRVQKNTCAGASFETVLMEELTFKIVP